ncbi:hypothetical protein [Legionella spiritensis]|uniref:Transmembrane protein n=1 Tax=Legionella spiritensis TaxID=452 RepID=A0A0W0ZAC9_LEGSP|nr:hypothetical protein [Legionella spiritensis]KTD65993.1 hypothetical protein Lspi_0282 [Legionella spiritensis]SNV23474.1 Uncharacterised protein [Legionella spiritensis]
MARTKVIVQGVITALLLPTGIFLSLVLSALFLALMALVSPVLVAGLAISGAAITSKKILDKLFPLDFNRPEPSPLKMVTVGAAGVLLGFGFMLLYLAPSTLLALAFFTVATCVIFPYMSVMIPYRGAKMIVDFFESTFFNSSKQSKRHDNPLSRNDYVSSKDKDDDKETFLKANDELRQPTTNQGKHHGSYAFGLLRRLSRRPSTTTIKNPKSEVHGYSHDFSTSTMP